MDTLICAQLNTQHCKAAMAHLSLCLTQNKIDILFNQEPYCYDGNPSLLPSNYTSFHVNTNNDPRACILIRSEIAHNFTLLHQFSTSDSIILVTQSNPPIYIASSYLPPYNTLEQDLSPTEIFLTSVNPSHFIWGLDANSHHNLWYSPSTDARGRLLVDFLSRYALVTVNEKDRPTFSGALGESWIDLTVTNTNLAHRVQNWGVSEEVTLSDHNLIIFTLDSQCRTNYLRRQLNNSTRKFATQVGKWNTFRSEVRSRSQQWLIRVRNANTKEKLDDAVTMIWDELDIINRRCFPLFAPTTRYTPWWTPELQTIRKQVNAAKRRFNRCKNAILKELYKTRFKALRNHYKTELLKAKQDSWKKFCTESTKKSPWKIYKMAKAGFSRRPVHTTLTLKDGSVTTSDMQTASALLDNFFPDDRQELDTDQQRTVRTQTANNKPLTTELEPHFTKHEVDEVITALKLNKCPGPDGVDGRIVKEIHHILPDFWMKIYNKCLELGCFPQAWKSANVIAIPKGDKSKSQSITGYRGISLLSTSGKCLEKLLMARLNYFLQSTGVIPPQQYGFTAGKSTADAIKTVTDFAQQSKHLGLKCCLLTLDIAGAFDNAWHPSLLASLLKMKCPANIYNIMRDFLQDRTAHFKMGNSSCSKPVTKGCPQGSVAGPTIWNIIISDLITQLSDTPHLELVVYADDIMIMIRGHSHTHILTKIMDTLTKIEEWCKAHKLQISKDKTAVMPMFVRKKDEYKNHPTIVQEKLNVVSKIKYLGVIIDSKLDWFPHTQFLENKLTRIRNNLVRCSRATWGISYYNLKILYEYAILPVITYAAEVWSTKVSKRASTKLTHIQRSFLITITKAYKTVSTDALLAIAGIMPINLAIRLNNDNKALIKGLPTEAVISQLRNIEIPSKERGFHPTDNTIRASTSGELGQANVMIYTDGSKTEHHVGAGVIAVKDSNEIFTGVKRLSIECTVFQAELCGMLMAVEWIKQQKIDSTSYAIHVDSKAALFAVTNKNTTHPLALDIRSAIINIKKTTPVTLHWVKGHTGLWGNERADYLAKTAACHKTTIGYSAIPLNRGKQLLKEYYIKLWNAIYTNSEVATHTKPFIPNIFHRLSLSLWPNHILTQFLTNHGCFQSYLFKMNIVTSPICNCCKEEIQTALHLLTQCSRFERERPAVLKTLPLPQVLKYHINTTQISSFISNVFRSIK